MRVKGIDGLHPARLTSSLPPTIALTTCSPVTSTDLKLATLAPNPITSIRSVELTTKLWMSWLTTTMPRPSFAKVRISIATCAAAEWLSAAVGSSKITTSGFHRIERDRDILSLAARHRPDRAGEGEIAQAHARHNFTRPDLAFRAADATARPKRIGQLPPEEEILHRVEVVAERKVLI